MSFVAPPRLPAGTFVGGHYVIERFIARGSVSEVYRARAEGSRELVALKILDERAGHGSRERCIAYFLREAAVTAQVHHPNIVELHEVGFDPEAGHYIALEFLPGTTLQHVVEQEGPLSEARARSILLQILGALSAAHHQGILHRDLKPSNIQLLGLEDDPDQIRLFDFGVAKLVDDQLTMNTLTKADTLVGTPQWMSPEQCRGLALDERSDVYSAGAVLYFLLAGRPPFQNDRILRVLNAVLTEPPESIDEVRQRGGLGPLPKLLERAIRRSLLKQPEQRFLDAAHFQAFLDRDTPSIQWSISHTTGRRRHLSEAPGLLAVRTLNTADATSGPHVAELVDDLLGEIDSDAELVERYGSSGASVVFSAMSSPSGTILETAATGVRLLPRLEECLAGVPVRLLAAVGNPTLGLSGEVGHAGPLLDHLHDILRDPARWSGEAPVTASGHFLVTGLTSLLESGLLVLPEWIHDLRQDFEIARIVPGLHGLGRILSQRDSTRESARVPAAELVLELLCGQYVGMDVGDLERALHLSADPIEVLTAIAELQSDDLVRIDSAGRAHAVTAADGTYPHSHLPVVERRLLPLRVYSLLAQQHGQTGSALDAQVENLEAGHPPSSVRLWIELAGQVEPHEAERCLYRALRLEALRRPQVYVDTILDGLAATAHLRAQLARAARRSAETPPLSEKA